MKEKLEKKLYEIAKTERNTNKMIIYSLILYTFCRLPELCLYLYLIIVSEASSFIYAAFGPVAINIVEYMYVVSYSFNLLFLFKFNKNVKQTFKSIFSKQKQQQQQQK